MSGRQLPPRQRKRKQTSRKPEARSDTSKGTSAGKIVMLFLAAWLVIGAVYAAFQAIQMTGGAE